MLQLLLVDITKIILLLLTLDITEPLMPGVLRSELTSDPQPGQRQNELVKLGQTRNPNLKGPKMRNPSVKSDHF
jgi:hypothetical protein